MIVNKINKLKAMSSREIAFRVKEKAIGLSERLFHLTGIGNLTDSQFAAFFPGSPETADIRSIFINTNRPFFTQSYEKTARIRQMKEHLDYQKWISEADKILSGKLNLLGKQVDPDGDSNQDPITKVAWPKKFYRDVEKSKELSDCDIKYIYVSEKQIFLTIYDT